MSTKSNEAQSEGTEGTEGKKNPSPHDRFVQSVLEIREVAESFFKAHLPPKLVQAINWSTFAIMAQVFFTCGHNRAPGPIYAPLGLLYLHLPINSILPGSSCGPLSGPTDLACAQLAIFCHLPTPLSFSLQTKPSPHFLSFPRPPLFCHSRESGNL